MDVLTTHCPVTSSEAVTSLEVVYVRNGPTPDETDSPTALKYQELNSVGSSFLSTFSVAVLPFYGLCLRCLSVFPAPAPAFVP